MADNLREVIAKMKANQNSQQQKPVEEKPKPTPAPVKKEIEDDYVDDVDEEIQDEAEMSETEEKTPIKQEKQVADTSKDRELQENAQRVMLLQDNGIFRAEMLNQLNDIRQALILIAQVLVDLSGNGKDTK